MGQVCFLIMSIPDRSLIAYFVIICLERAADLLTLLCMMFRCILPLSHMVSQVRCSISFYIFLIVDFFFTFMTGLAGCQIILSQCMRFPTMWYVRTTKPQISLRMHIV